MINSLFMLGSSYNRDRKISIAFILGWITYMAINQVCFGISFSFINAAVFLVVTISINLIKNKKVNTILSVFSILIWSILIDIICYFLYPIYTANQNIFEYVCQGIIFNSKYIISNSFAICAIYGLDCLITKIENNIQLKKVVETK